MTKSFALVLLAFICCNCTSNQEITDTTDTIGIGQQLGRINYAINLKNEVAKASWPEAAKQDLFVPLAFYTYEGTFVLNPNEHILQNFKHEEINLAEANFPIIKLSPEYLDTINFNYANSYTDNDSTQLYYNDVVLLFTDFDLTQKFVPVEDLQDWCIMVLHEMFHSYQTSIPSFQQYNKSVMYGKSPDDYLGTYHKELDWYKESVEKENALLVAIWKDSADLETNLKAFYELRNKRIDRIKQAFDVDIREVEDIEMLLEGHARFFEGLTREYLANHQPDDSMLQEADKTYITNMFDGYQAAKGKGLYNIYNDRYWYPLGFNIAMILRKYNPDYQKSLYHKAVNFNDFLDALVKNIESE